METIRYTEKRKSTKWPAIFVTTFLVLGGAFVAYGIKFEDNPKMLGFSTNVVETDTNALENVTMTEAEKMEQARNLNYEVKDVSSIDQSNPKYVSNIHLPTVYVDGKEIVELNAKIQSEYTTRFENLKSKVGEKAESSYSFNVTYTYYDNMVGTKKIVSLVIKQQIIDTDSQKVTAEKLTAYNIDLASKDTVSQSDVVFDLLGKDYKDILKKQVKEYVVSNKLIAESKYNYEITGLESFYIQDNEFHIVFNMDSDPIVNDSKGILDIKIERK